MPFETTRIETHDNWQQDLHQPVKQASEKRTPVHEAAHEGEDLMEEAYKGYYILYSPSVEHNGIWTEIYSPQCGGKWLSKYIIANNWSKNINVATHKAHAYIDYLRKDIKTKEYEHHIAKFLK